MPGIMKTGMVRRFGSGGEVSFSPDDIAGLEGWWKADSLVLSDNDPVTTWADESGNGRDLTSATGQVYKANILNSLPVVRFDGIDDKLNYFPGADWLTGTDLTLFALFIGRGTPAGSIRTVSASANAADDFGNNTGFAFGLNVAAGHERTFYDSASRTTQTHPGSDVAQLHSVRWDAGGASHRYNQAASSPTPTSADVQTFAIRNFSVAAQTSGAAFRQVDMAEILVYLAALDTAGGSELEQVEGYLADKWGL
jgi:hypothetical protein